MVIKKLYQKYKKSIDFWIPTIFAVFIIRFIFSYLPSFGFDMGTWFGWANKLASKGFASFYTSPDWTQYTPGYLYWLWLIGKFGWLNEFAIKVPIILADIFTGFLIWSIVKKTSVSLANISFYLYVLNPVVIFDGSVWGQIDGLLAMLLFLSAYFLTEKKSLFWSVFFWSIGFLIKPQAIAIAPIFLLMILLKKFKLKEIVISIFTGLFILFVGSLPYFPKNPILGLPQLVLKMTNYYAYTSVNGFNIWSWVGMWQPDTVKFLGVSYSIWGTLFLVSADLLALFLFRNKLNKKGNHYLLFAILCLSFFLFPTKVHERYLFPFFAFILASASLLKSRNIFCVFGLATLVNFLNLYYAYAYYNKNFLFNQSLYNLSLSLVNIIGFMLLVAYFALLWWEKLPKFNLKLSLQKTTAKVVAFPKVKLPQRKMRLLLYGVIAFAFVTRIFSLWSPPKEYFDEVYHAFTAKVILSPDAAKAWEWWNTPPTGFAYEWTHPPLAKLGMALGMVIFGQNSFGWRLPEAILGTISVLLVYLIAKELFKDELLAILSAAVLSLDGLVLVMSRIGMNDSYMLCFMLLSIYLFLRQKNFLSALSFGLAISSKWSAIWAIPILFIIWLKQKDKFRLSTLWFLILPPVIYLSAYSQMFLTGHNLSVWWEMQKQMWWYHTGLRATHAYSSLWWSWPFLIRPIYLYTSEEVGGMVSRIYAFGNPLVFWFGLASVVLSFAYAFYEKNKKLGLVVFSYLIFFVPWALSPRIMFLYHYLPSIPFLAIASGFILRRNPKLILGYLAIGLLVYLYFYPHWTGISIPLWLDKSYYWVPSWR